MVSAKASVPPRSRLMRASCAYYAQELLTSPRAKSPPYYGRFLVGQHHESWDQLIHRGQRICVLASRDHGKCKVAGTLLLRSDGARVPVEAWDGGEVLAYDPQTHQLTRAWSPPARVNGLRPVVRVTTRTGRQVTVTRNEPLRLWDRWLPAADLVPGQRIAVPREYPTLDGGTLPADEAWLLGLLTGDGGFTGSSVTVTAYDHAVVAELTRVAAGRGGKLTVASKGCVWGNWRLKGAVPWARGHALMGSGAHTKRVPAAVFTASLRDVAEFVSGYLDSDAHVSRHAGGSVEFYSVSQPLLRDVQHLLVRLGVVAVLTPKRGKYAGQVHHSWRLTVRGGSLCKLAAHCQPRGGRGEVLAALAMAQAGKEECGSVDLLPKEAYALVRHGPHWFASRGHPKPCPQYDLTRAKARTLAAAEGNLALHLLADGAVLWDEVVSVEDLGAQQTWSVYVPGLENYCADDVVTHNTFFWDFAYPIWKAEQQPDGRGYIFSGSEEQAIRILGDISEQIENNDRLRHLYPVGPGKVWSATVIELANGHRIYAKGFGTKTRGAHPQWAVCDDVLNDEDAYSEIVRRKKIDYFYTAISGMMTPESQLVVVGTPFHGMDLYAELAANPEYVFERYPAINPDGTPLWPARYNLARLAAKRREIGSVRFTREYLCQPISDDMSLFPGHLFQGQPTEQLAAVLGKPARFWNEHGITRRFIGVDLAISSSTGADFTVIFVMGLDQWGNRWVLDIIREKGLGFQQQLSLINAAGRKYDPDLIFLEANQMQRVFGDELLRTTDLPIKKFITTGVGKAKNKQPSGNTTTANKNTLEGGVPSLRVLLENKKFRIPRGDARSVEVTDQWISEMRSFTWLDGKLQGVGAHDDTVLACWIADQAIRQGGFSFSTGEDEAELDPKTGKPKVESLEDFLATQMAEPKAREERPNAPDPVESLLTRYRDNPLSVGTGEPGEEREEGEPGRASGNLVDAEDEDLGVDSSALSALFPFRR